ncbi:MAG: biotin--[acetyl-CoA-carboxylase] ligase [Gammaproteobacteria bacterium]
MTVQQRLLQTLADGELHSGSELAAGLGITRSAVWKQIKNLKALGIEVDAQAGQGYRLNAPHELLELQAIQRELTEASLSLLEELNLSWMSESTSNELLQQAPPNAGSARVFLAEYQSAGRGRRGRNWYAPAGHSICLSVGWTYATSPADFSCLGLAVGIATLRAVKRAGVTHAQLKWPNDVVAAGKKLAGVLIDVQGEAGGPLYIVVGVGVNYRLSDQVRNAVNNDAGLEPISLAELSENTLVGRNVFAANLIDEIIRVLAEFSNDGFGQLVDEWDAADCLSGNKLEVTQNDKTLTGIARGITSDGRLKLDTGNEMHLLVSGDVSLRKDS